MRIRNHLATAAAMSLALVPVLASAAPAGAAAGAARTSVQVAAAAASTPFTAVGTVTAVNTTARTLTLQTGSQPVTLPVSTGTVIKVNDKVSPLGDVKRGYQVDARGTRTGDTLTIATISATPPRPAPFETTGMLTGVDPKARTIAVQTFAEGRNTTATLPVATSTRITINDKTATLAELKPNTRVTVQGTKLGNDVTVSTVVVLTPLELKGTITVVNTPARTITVQLDSDRKDGDKAKATGSTTVLTVGAGVMIFVDDRPSGFADLRTGYWVALRGITSGNRFTLEEIDASSPQPRPFMIDGTVRAVNAGAGTLTVQPHGYGDGPAPEPVQLPISTGTVVEVNDVAGSLAGVRTGMAVAVLGTRVRDQVIVDQVNAAVVKLEPFATSGTVGAVNTTAGTLSIRFDGDDASPPPPFVVTVTAATAVKLEGKTARLVDLRPGMTVAVLGSRVDDRDIAEQITAITPVPTPMILNGTVAAVNSSARTVTVRFDDQEQNTWTISVPTKARVKVNDRTGSLTDLKAGFSVMVLGSGNGPTFTADRVVAVAPSGKP